MSDTRPLSELSAGETGIISRLGVDEALYHRLSAMGLRIGRPIKVVRKAAISGPIQIRVGFTDLIVRRADALHIGISPISV